MLNGDQRDSTNKLIRQYLGTYDDFILTAVSLQNNNTGFIDKSQRERKDLLSQFLDIDIFDQQYQLANEEIKETAAAIKEHKRTDYSTELSDAITTINAVSSSFQEYDIERADLIVIRDALRAEVLDTTKELKPIDDELTDMHYLQQQYSHFTQSAVILQSTITDCNVDLANTHAAVDKCQLQHDNLIIENYPSKIKECEDGIYYINTLNGDLKNHQDILSHKESLSSQLDTHEYDPNCTYCVSNPIVQTAIHESKTIPNIINRIDELVIEIDHSSSLYSKELYNSLKTELDQSAVDMNQATRTYSAAKLAFSNADLEFQSVIWNLDKYADLIEEAETQKEAVKANVELNAHIITLESELSSTELEINELDARITRLRPKLIIAQKTKKDVEKSIERLIELEQSYTGYEYYLKAVKRDGVPYDLIAKALPQIEAEVNNILTQIVEFTVLLNTDGKNINAYIVYDTDNYWPLELTSGMEKFIASLAIRASLIHVSSLPRPNFIAIDEGFGNLDSDNLNSMYLLFDYLKSQFGFILSISHIDAMRDIVDNLIEIKKESGYSKISYG